VCVRVYTRWPSKEAPATGLIWNARSKYTPVYV
jgi:hypothetical protein